MRSRALVLVAVAIAPVVSSAQSSPITRPKESAQRAVAATNTHTATMTSDTSMGKAATPPANPAARSSRSPNGDTTRARVTTSKGMTDKPERATFEREVFSYERGGRRDPFISLMKSGEIRPLLADLRLVGIAYDVNGRNSVAVLREDAQEVAAQANKQTTGAAPKTQATVDIPMYRVREGQQIGRMRVARIGPKSITFTIEEFGYSRQETLTLSESNTEKKP